MNNKKILEVQKKIVPEIVELMYDRYHILSIVEKNQPIGRRMLSSKLNKTERIVRSEVEKLKEYRLLEFINSGIILTDDGLDLLRELDGIMMDSDSISILEDELREKLGIKNVVIVPGDVTKDKKELPNLGIKSSDFILSKLKSDDTIAIAGGTTMALVAGYIKSVDYLKNITVVPARGALNEEPEIQANTIAFRLSKKLGANCKMLYIPDDLSAEELQAVKKNGSINDVLNVIDKTDVLIFSLGGAYDMAVRRKAGKDILDNIKANKLVAEAFGYFFDGEGNMRMQMNSVGITLDKIKTVEESIAVAVGDEKAEVIVAFSNFYKNFSLITDEATALKIINK